jgi:hypothetical protein
MTEDHLRALALKVLQRRDSCWDSGGASAEKGSGTLSRVPNPAGTLKTAFPQRHNPSVPASRTLGAETLGQHRGGPSEGGTARGTVAGQSPYSRTLQALTARCPDYVTAARWQRAVTDSESFVAKWGEQAQALGWAPRDLWGLHQPPEQPAPSYSRLSRYDATGLCWLLDGREVTALSSSIAAIRSATGAITKYRKDNKPALGPVGDSLEDFK